ncbi:putative disease resistance protein RGA3 [Dendrobium catenatum]|uniref:Disease resistance protein RGA1 n=1 Tax=Dendrobium catenatum TaxID=906689 RepID=A0A2I0XI16_9ASPA|nr:putative disease resistance protein RGA3 [Dendrobium catenatum]PKU87563.1 Putative disease resistance protein RGA1 [Dendrobium catenatum]
MSKWERLLTPLADGKIGSRILVTTRMDSVAKKIARVIQEKTVKFTLEGLEEDQCLRLLNLHAFVGVENPSDDDHKKLNVIAGEIVKKLLGSPLAAKVIGGVLNDDLDERHWRTVLESNLLGENSINSILRLSYVVLPNYLQNCFAFCCMFPQDHTFDKDDLVQMWISLGFIQPSQGMTMEDIGGRYFDALVNKTLVEQVRGHYKMHDLIYESASKFFAQICGKFVDDEESSLKISEIFRYLFVETTNPDIIQKIGQFKHLHSLFLFYKAFNEDICSALIEIFRASRSLRLLYVCAPYLKEIPEEIGNLIHLRCLKIVGYNLTTMPRSLSNLYHLQYLIYDSPGEVERLHEGDDFLPRERRHKADDFLPHDINSLPNLRYMKLPKSYSSLIRWIGKLKSRPEQVVSGYRSIGELKNMNDFCILKINRLEYVKDTEEARNVQLCEKTRLTDLTLCWTRSDSWKIASWKIALYENVLDNLQPPNCLRKLSINGYWGARSAIWMNNVNMIFNLEEINLTGCKEWETLPPFGQLPFLKSLRLKNMPKVKLLESKFNGNDKHHAFPCLIKLELWDVPMLQELPNLPPSLEGLRIKYCHPELKKRYGEDGGPDRHKIAHIPEIYIST